ncbi:uncharacterized protein EDB91DRAFT_1122559 [Suillus paluster]|uniref:uncharacterized protein n=1 Tax=Suillus paluster TaxID=48578 RepID=UPI001B880D03|nr:uncharacterized protein EDB91DRAFT_1122559 [Suillus paluster]KAG1745113.1 hypothetical protein EDB91DRAFT_1122559 [Suillus paluster]
MEAVDSSIKSPRILRCPVKMIDKATLQTATYNIKHIATGQYVTLKDTMRKSTLIALHDSHFERLAWVLDKLAGLKDTYHVRSFLQNTFARTGQFPTAGAEIVSGTESYPWLIRPAASDFGDIYLISPYSDPSLYWTIVKTRDGTNATLTNNPKHHVYWQFVKMSA